MMQLRKSISGTKKLLQKTLGSLKSLFSKGNYEKLPKSSPQINASVNRVHTDYKELDKLYTEYWNNIEVGDHQSSKRKKIMITSPSTPTKRDGREFQSGSLKQQKQLIAHSSSPVKPIKNVETERIQRAINNNNNKVEKNREEEEGRSSSWLVEEKLKELEMLDISNVEHVLDIEEVLHYYSRLTCPAYLEIVDKFFLDIYAEFFKPPPPTTPATTRFNFNSSRLRPRTSLNPRSS